MDRWTHQEIAILNEHYLKEGASVVGRLPKRTQKAVASKAHKLGLRCTSYRRSRTPWWTAEETETLKQYYPVEGQEVAKRLPCRTPGAVRRKAQVLGIHRRFNYEHVWRAGVECKVCAKCGDWKPLDEFYCTAQPRDGLGTRCKECVSAYYYEHADEYRANRRKYGEEQREQLRQQARAYNQSPRGRAVRQLVMAKRRVTERRGDFTLQQWEELISQHARCPYCGHPFDEDTHKLTLDHIIPVSRDGKHTKDNVLPACFKCNRSKGSKVLGEEWLPWELFDGAGHKIRRS